MVSTRFLVEYSDQNESFARFLPRAGQVIRDFSDTAGNSGWYLLELDQPFDYQIKVGEPYQFRGTTITHFLIRSRWLGHALGGPEPVSVFVLLVEDGSVPTQGPIDVKHYFHQHGECVESRPTAPNTTLKPTSGAKSAKAKPVRTPRRSRLSV